MNNSRKEIVSNGPKVQDDLCMGNSKQVLRHERIENEVITEDPSLSEKANTIPAKPPS
jgi:hypothetical protein